MRQIISGTTRNLSGDGKSQPKPVGNGSGRGALAYYSPYYFLRLLAGGQQQELFGTGAAARWERAAGETTFRCQPSVVPAEVH